MTHEAISLSENLAAPWLEGSLLAEKNCVIKRVKQRPAQGPAPCLRRWVRRMANGRDAARHNEKVLARSPHRPFAVSVALPITYFDVTVQGLYVVTETPIVRMLEGYDGGISPTPAGRPGQGHTASVPRAHPRDGTRVGSTARAYRHPPRASPRSTGREDSACQRLALYSPV